MGHPDHVAVGLGVIDRGHGDPVPGPGLVFDEDVDPLGQVFLHVAADGPGIDIKAAAGRAPEDPANILFGIVLGLGG